MWNPEQGNENGMDDPLQTVQIVPGFCVRVSSDFPKSLCHANVNNYSYNACCVCVCVSEGSESFLLLFTQNCSKLDVPASSPSHRGSKETKCCSVFNRRSRFSLFSRDIESHAVALLFLFTWPLPSLQFVKHPSWK